MTDFTNLVDLASRRMGSGVIFANDEAFAEKESLIQPHAPGFTAENFGNKGQVYDGWETRRRRDQGYDWAIIRLGTPGIIRGVVIDTAWFKGNYPPFVSVEACAIDGNPSVDEVQNAKWTSILDKSPAEGHTANKYEIKSEKWWTHLRLCMHPDGGIARFRAHGDAMPDPRWIAARETIDLACIDSGSDLIDCSDAFYSSARNTLQPGLPLSQGDGWENRRRREGGNDFYSVRLGLPGVITAVEVDTTHFKGNAPGEIMLTAGKEVDDVLKGNTTAVVAKTRVQPDTQHHYVINDDTEYRSIRLDVYPDGGLGRLHVWGRPSKQTMAEYTKRWLASAGDGFTLADPTSVKGLTD